MYIGHFKLKQTKPRSAGTKRLSNSEDVKQNGSSSGSKPSDFDHDLGNSNQFCLNHVIW